MERIAQLTKQTRDDSFVEALPDGRTVNHSLGIGSLGGATLDNEGRRHPKWASAAGKMATSFLKAKRLSFRITFIVFQADNRSPI
jgi:hypothetical protein